MAERRMFAKSIIDSDAFIDMPVTARLLYYDLSMRADDDGFVNSPKKIMRMIGASQDDLSILILRKFIIPFESGVVVIKHWKIHNYIQKDRYNPTKYQKEKQRLEIKNNGSYSLQESTQNSSILENVSIMDTECIQDVSNMDTQVRLGKVSIGKDIKEKYKKEKTETVYDVIDEYTDNENLIKAIKDFIKFRKAIKAPLTDRALQLNLNKLDKLADTDEKKIAVINQSIEKGWKSLYELKQPIKQKEEKDASYFDKYNFVINDIPEN